MHRDGRVSSRGGVEDLLGKAEIAERYLGVGARFDAWTRHDDNASNEARVQGLEGSCAVMPPAAAGTSYPVLSCERSEAISRR